MPEPPEGHYYREVPGGRPPYQLQAFPGKAGALAEVDARYRVVEENGTYKLEVNKEKPLTYDERAKQRIEIYRDNQYFQGVRSRYPELDEGLASYAAMYEDRLRGVLGERVPPDFFDDIMQPLSQSSLRGDPWEGLYREQLRAKILRQIDEYMPSQQYEALHQWLGAQPNNGAKGSLFQAYQERNIPSGMQYQKPELNDTSFTVVGQDGKPFRIKADSITEIVNTPAPGAPKPGKYLVEDKAGTGAFDEEQFKRYAEILAKGDLTTMSGKRFDGLVYFFDSELSLASALAFLKDHPELGQRLFVAHLDKNAQFKWLMGKNESDGIQ